MFANFQLNIYILEINRYNQYVKLTKKNYVKTGFIYCFVLICVYLVFSLLAGIIYGFLPALNHNSKIVEYLFFSKALEKIPFYVRLPEKVF
jgi:membrane protein required for beta-lactamase induction